MVQCYNSGENKQTVIDAYVNEIIQFAQILKDDMNGLRDYGTGVPIKMAEVYTLSLIEQNPGITVERLMPQHPDSALAQKQRRTKGTVSVNVTALENKGYIYREKRSGNEKVVHLYATSVGEKLSTLYNAYNAKQTRNTQDKLLKNCSQEDINVFCRVHHQYLKTIVNNQEAK